MSAVPQALRDLDPRALAAFRQAVQLQRSGHGAAAEPIYRQLLRHYPEHPEVLHFLGVLLYDKRDFRGAAEHLERGLARAPERPGVHLVLGMVYEAAGDRPRAIQHLSEGVRRHPDQLDARLRLAQLQIDTKDLASAQTQLEDARERWPDSAQVLNLLGTVYYRTASYDKAVATFEAALKHQPDDYAVLTNLGKIYLLREDQDRALEYYGRALAVKPDAVPTMVAKAQLLHMREETTEALELLRRALNLDPEYPEGYLELSRINRDLKHDQKSLSCIERATELAPLDFAIRTFYGYALHDNDRSDEACSQFERVTAGDPGHAEAWMGLAVVHEFRNRLPDAKSALAEAERLDARNPALNVPRAKLYYRDGRFEDAVTELREVQSRRNVGPGLKRAIHFELSKHLDRLGRSAEAYAEIQAGNDIVAEGLDETMRPGNNTYLNMIHATVDAFTPEWGARLRALKPVEYASDHEWPAPVLLCGFPRSGTTLLDQILDAHPRIKVIDERPMLSRLVSAAHRLGDYPSSVADMDEGQVQEIREAYYKEFANWIEPGAAPVIIDKMPLATGKVPLLMRVLKDLKIVLAIRHPMDACLSCFMQDFTMNQAMTNFVDMGRTVELYDATMSVWRRSVEMLEPSYHRVRYEDLVQDKEREARGILDFLGVGWDDAVMDHVKHALSGRRINTPSYRQVSQQVYKHAAYRWERYREQLEPHIPVIAPWAEYFGYGDPMAPGSDGPDA